MGWLMLGPFDLEGVVEYRGVSVAVRAAVGSESHSKY